METRFARRESEPREHARVGNAPARERPARRYGRGRHFGQRKREPIFLSTMEVDYKDTPRLSRCIDGEGKILPRRRLGHSVQVQRSVTAAIKRARHVGLLPFSRTHQ